MKIQMRCKYGEACHFSHSPVTAGKFLCYKYGEEFTNIQGLMRHHKSVHGEMCRKTSNNKCKYTQLTCWFNHNESNVTNESVVEREPVTTPIFHQDCQEPAPLEMLEIAQKQGMTDNYMLSEIMNLLASVCVICKKIVNVQGNNISK